MYPSLRRLFQGATATALMATAAVTHAVTPKDHAMAYTIDSTNQGVGLGLRLVASANFTQGATLVAANIPVRQPHGYLSGSVSNGVYTDFRPELLSWGQGNRWMRAPLRSGLKPKPVQVSSENAVDKVCSSFPVARDQRTATTSLLFYVLPGPDNACGLEVQNAGADDVVRVINLNDGPTTAPRNLPDLRSAELFPVYETNGVLRTILAFDRGRLLAYTPDLAAPSTVVSGLTESGIQGQAPDASVLLIIQGNLRRISRDRVLVTAPVRAAPAGFAVKQALVDGSLPQGDVYILEAAQNPAARIKTRLLRARGNSRPVALANLRLGDGALQGLSDARLIFSAGGGFDISDPTNPRFLPTDLLSVPRSGGSPPARLLRVASGSISVAHVSGDKVFYNASSIDFAAGALRQTAYVSADTGGKPLKNFRAGSAWNGRQFANANEVRLLLATRGLEGGTQGARLLAVHPETLTSTTLVGKLPATDQVGFGFAFGRGGIGSLFVDSAQAPGADVFAFDLFDNRFRRLTANGGSKDEFPVF